MWQLNHNSGPVHNVMVKKAIMMNMASGQIVMSVKGKDRSKSLSTQTVAISATSSVGHSSLKTQSVQHMAGVATDDQT